MKYTLKEQGDKVVIAFTGELVLSDEEEFRGLSERVHEMPIKHCSVDITGLEFMDSAGLGLLLVLKEMTEENGASISLKVADGPVREILDISEFESLIPYE